MSKRAFYTSAVLEDDLCRKYLVITPKMSKLKIHSRIFSPVQIGGFQETACPKDRQDGSWLSPCSWIMFESGSKRVRK